jgi:hypothetical protein
VDNWKNKKYVVWALAIPSALFGYFVPYVHIVSSNPAGVDFPIHLIDIHFSQFWREKECK